MCGTVVCPAQAAPLRHPLLTGQQAVAVAELPMRGQQQQRRKQQRGRRLLGSRCGLFALPLRGHHHHHNCSPPLRKKRKRPRHPESHCADPPSSSHPHTRHHQPAGCCFVGSGFRSSPPSAPGAPTTPAPEAWSTPPHAAPPDENDKVRGTATMTTKTISESDDAEGGP